MNLQDEEELWFFKKFAKHCLPFFNEISSIENQKPPKPDILCQCYDGTHLAFELVECIDSDLARDVNNSLKFKRIMEKALLKLPLNEASRFRSKYGNALISIVPNKGLTFKKLSHSARQIIELLQHLNVNEKGDYDFRKDREIGNLISWIFISYDYPYGPEIELGTFTFVSDCCEKYIEKKFDKRYETTCKIDLLAYYCLQPREPENLWLPAVEVFLKNNLGTSIFNRVWIYSSIDNKVLFVYPSL